MKNAAEMGKNGEYWLHQSKFDKSGLAPEDRSPSSFGGVLRSSDTPFL